jgi:hypothetical protein
MWHDFFNFPEQGWKTGHLACGPKYRWGPDDTPFLLPPRWPAAHPAGSGCGGQARDPVKRPEMSTAPCSPKAGFPGNRDIPARTQFPFIPSPAAEHGSGPAREPCREHKTPFTRGIDRAIDLYPCDLPSNGTVNHSISFQQYLKTLLGASPPTASNPLKNAERKEYEN